MSVVVTNSKVWKEFRKGMEGAAEEAGFTCEQDVVDYCKQIRREMWGKYYINKGGCFVRGYYLQR